MEVKSKLEMMQEIHVLTRQTIILTRIEEVNAFRTCEALKVKRAEAVEGYEKQQKELETATGKEAYEKRKAAKEFHKKWIEVFDHQYKLTEMGAMTKKQEADNGEISLAILEEMIAEEQKAVPAGQPATAKEIKA